MKSRTLIALVALAGVYSSLSQEEAPATAQILGTILDGTPPPPAPPKPEYVVLNKDILETKNRRPDRHHPGNQTHRPPAAATTPGTHSF